MAGFPMSRVLWLNVLLVSLDESSFPSEVGHVTRAETGHSGVGPFLKGRSLPSRTVPSVCAGV